MVIFHSYVTVYQRVVQPIPNLFIPLPGRAVQVVYDPEKISLVDILRWFWEAHDPTQGTTSEKFQWPIIKLLMNEMSILEGMPRFSDP